MFSKKEIEWILCGLEILEIQWENQIDISKACLGGTGNIQDEIETIFKINKKLSDIKALINKIENI